MTNESNEASAWEAQAFTGGWLRLRRRVLIQGEVKAAGDPETTAYLRVGRNSSGGLEVREAAMMSGGPIDASSWRDVPFSMAALITAPFFHAGFGEDEWLAAGGPTLADILGKHEPADGGATVFIGPSAPGTGKLAALKAPARNLTDEFLAELADAYRELVAAKRNPAPAIADQTGAPVASVRRWIGVARKRGFLPQATKGRAG